MFLKSKNVTIIPMLDPKRQMIIAPLSTVKEEAAKSKQGLAQVVRSFVKSVRASNVEKFEQVLMPSFRLKDTNQELPRTMSHVKISDADDGL